jgi:hypothetical protein
MSAASTRLGWGMGMVLVLTASLLPAVSARAEFSVGPAVRDLLVAQGKAVAGSFAVRLDGERRGFVVQVEDVVQLPDGGYAYKRPSRSRFSASTWLAVGPRSFRGSPDRVQPVDFRLRVPSDAEPGDHAASITVKQVPPRGRPGAVAVQAISFRLNVRVPGKVREQVELGSLGIPEVVGRGPVDAGVIVRNTGNVRLYFDRHNEGSLSITSGSQRRARLAFRGQLYPGRSRAFKLAWEDPPALGRFEAKASVRTRGGRVTESDSFWMIPWRQAGALLLVGLAAGLVYLGRRRRRALAEGRAG